jgi:hypothetical protein
VKLCASIDARADALNDRSRRSAAQSRNIAALPKRRSPARLGRTKLDQRQRFANPNEIGGSDS